MWKFAIACDKAVRCRWLCRLAAASGLLISSGPGCRPIDLLNAVAPDTGAEHLEGVAYGNHPRQQLDLYLPRPSVEDAPPPAVVVFFYGGSWSSGSRADYVFMGQLLAGLGYVAVIPDYRLHPEVGFPAFVEDGAAAVAWITDEANQATHGGDATRVALMGHSAGAHLASLLAYDDQWLMAAGASPRAVRGFVGLAGPYDLFPYQIDLTRGVFAGADPARVEPMGHVGHADPPALLLHGGGDEVVPPADSASLAAALRGAGVEVTLLTLPDVDHVRPLTALVWPLREDRVYAAVAHFLAAALEPPGPDGG